MQLPAAPTAPDDCLPLSLPCQSSYTSWGGGRERGPCAALIWVGLVRAGMLCCVGRKLRVPFVVVRPLWKSGGRHPVLRRLHNAIQNAMPSGERSIQPMRGDNYVMENAPNYEQLRLRAFAHEYIATGMYIACLAGGRTGKMESCRYDVGTRRSKMEVSSCTRTQNPQVLLRSI